LGSPFQSFVNSIVIDINNNVFAYGSDLGVRKISKYSNQTVTSTFILPLDKKYKQIS